MCRTAGSAFGPTTSSQGRCLCQLVQLGPPPTPPPCVPADLAYRPCLLNVVRTCSSSKLYGSIDLMEVRSRGTWHMQNARCWPFSSTSSWRAFTALTLLSPLSCPPVGSPGSTLQTWKQDCKHTEGQAPGDGPWGLLPHTEPAASKVQDFVGILGYW